MKMKRKMFSLLLALAMVLSCIPVQAMATSAIPANEEPIESAFTDAAFLRAVHKTVGKTDGEPIYPSDVEEITKLKINGLKNSSLDGIEYFTSLKELQCWNNTLTIEER